MLSCSLAAIRISESLDCPGGRSNAVGVDAAGFFLISSRFVLVFGYRALLNTGWADLRCNFVILVSRLKIGVAAIGDLTID